MNVQQKIKDVPNKPGCYIYYNKYKEVIYVGKAKKLKNRMSSYFNRENNYKTQHLVSKIDDFDYYITANESEALILENNLIKKYNPFYNIALKDDKRYPYIVITKEKYPRIIKTRKRDVKGIYFGPFTSGTFVTDLIKYLNKKTKLRKCITLPKEVCIYYHLGQCQAPCINKDLKKEDIQMEIQNIKKLFSNNMKGIAKLLLNDIEKKANNQLFEEAQELKNIYDQLLTLNQKQSVQLREKIDVDIINYYCDANFISLSILNIKLGKLNNIHRVMIPYYDAIEEEIISYLHEYYSHKKPEYFITPNDDLNYMIEKLLLISNKRSRQKEYRQLEEIAYANATEYYRLNVEKITKEYFKKEQSGFKELQNITNNSLKRIEMYDISHIGGDAQVGAMIVYTNGKKDKKEYRKYKIKDKNNLQDDYGSMREVLTRRIIRGIEEQNLPNLIILDGGKGQVSVVLEILERFEVDKKIQLIGLSKDDKHKTKGIVNKNGEERILRKTSELYKFFYELQEEVHRYAITFHREVKVKSLFHSELDKINGIGEKRKKLLIEHFKYVDNIKKAKEEDFDGLKIPKGLIIDIIHYFQNN